MSDPTVRRAAGADAIFISYRRGDTAYPAGWLYHQLVAHFGADQVFKDVDSIELGSDFVAEITTAVASCQCLLALIGRDWLSAVDARGRRRLDDPADFVRIEIEAALARGVRVVPVLVEEATMPYADELPPTLAPITRRQALVLSPTRFTADIAKLISVLERSFAEAAVAREAQSAPPATVEQSPPQPDAIAPAPDSAVAHEPAVRPPVDETPASRLPLAADVETAAVEPRRRWSRLPAICRRGLIAAPLLFLIALFLPWTSDLIGTRDGFSSLTLVVGWIMLLVAAGLVLLPSLVRTILSPQRRSLVTLVLTALALVCAGLGFAQARWTQTPGIGGLGLPRGADRSALVGAYGGVLVALAAATLAVLLLLADRKTPEPTTSHTVEPRVRIGYAVASGLLAGAAIIGAITRPLSVDERPSPFAGEGAWWSSYGNGLETTLTTTEPMDLSGASTVGVSAQINYDLEEGYDYVFGEVSTDDGETWTRPVGIVGGNAIWSDGETEGISGTSGDADEDGKTDWVWLNYDLNELGWDGETRVWFRFRYSTDASYVSGGAFIDDIVILYDDDEILRDGAEGADAGPWTADGFVKTP